VTRDCSIFSDVDKKSNKTDARVITILTILAEISWSYNRKQKNVSILRDNERDYYTVVTWKEMLYSVLS